MCISEVLYFNGACLQETVLEERQGFLIGEVSSFQGCP